MELSLRSSEIYLFEKEEERKRESKVDSQEQPTLKSPSERTFPVIFDILIPKTAIRR
jgi:hypothetical protein